MPFGLKNAGAMYQRLVDEAFQSQIRKNLVVYVDDMVVKSRTKKGMLADIAETFDNLRRINMKLNPKKCSFRVTKGKFLGGKLAALNRFLSRSAKKSLPFFETLKDITKKNKRDYRWTEKAEGAFQDLKKMALDLPTLTTPLPKETYLTLHDAERNYASLEKMALALRHVSIRLRRYFEAHPIIVITDQPIKHVLSKADTSGRLAPYSIELAVYNIMNEPLSAVKGQILEDFLNEFSSALQKRNTRTRYEALLVGLRIAKKIGVQSLSVNVDSKLVASQINGETLYMSSMDVEEINAIVEEECETWMTPIINFLERGIWPEDQNEARALRMKISQYVMEEGRNSHRACNMHLKARSVVAKVIQQGYYWPTMHRDAREEIRIVVETLERSLRLKTQCANQFDSGALGCSDLQSLFSSLGFSEAAEPSVGKMGTGSCPLCAMDNLIDTDPGIGNGSVDNLINTNLGVHNNGSIQGSGSCTLEPVIKAVSIVVHVSGVWDMKFACFELANDKPRWLFPQLQLTLAATKC
uniref:Reverse transcriptase domain-containing protein n=1 Tax=Tanacetum cinerariifolium TaxID=118510 RepID=A0A6L2NG27_TANCI|nr:hypothetical protein [Tanacetum cinerariifolium]